MIGAEWPYHQLTRAGRVTWFCTGGTEAHIGLFIPACTEEEVRQHSATDVSEVSARDKRDVCFDFLRTKVPMFQYIDGSFYNTSTVSLYKINNVDAADLHAVCLKVARAKPRNDFMYRLNALFWCWPLQCSGSNTEEVGPSHCAALTMRIIASARSNSCLPLTSDDATFAELRLPRFSASAPSAPQFLTGHSPRSAIEAMLSSGAIEPSSLRGLWGAESRRLKRTDVGSNEDETLVPSLPLLNLELTWQ